MIHFVSMEADMKKYDSRKQIVLDYVNKYYDDYGVVPSVRDIAAGTEIPSATVQRYLVALKEENLLEYNGRKSIKTERISKEAVTTPLPVIGYVACGPGEEEQQEIIEYIRMPESIIGKGEFFALIAKGESMIDAGINPGDYVIIRKQSSAKTGDIVVALYNGLNNLKKLRLMNDKAVLISCNENKEMFPDIVTDNLVIQGIAVSVIHKLTDE